MSQIDNRPRTDELLSLIDRLTCRIEELERWHAQMAEQVVTKKVLTTRVDVCHPMASQPAVTLSALSSDVTGASPANVQWRLADLERRLATRRTWKPGS